MDTSGHFLFLGTGGSMGIPVIGCHCLVCLSPSPCNHRLRPSGLITVGKKKILVDCGPDFRTQALSHHINQLDGLLLTHAHHDHVAGIDELRIYFLRTKTALPCLLSRPTSAEISTRYKYIFDNPSNEKLTSRLQLQLLEGAYGKTLFQNIYVQHVTYEQAGMLVNGFRIGDLAYLSDVKFFSEAIFDHLRGVQTLIISALRHAPSAFHLSVEEAIAFAHRVGAQQTWLTHISHELDHEETNSFLPPNVRMAYDGLELPFKAEVFTGE